MFFTTLVVLSVEERLEWWPPPLSEEEWPLPLLRTVPVEMFELEVE